MKRLLLVGGGHSHIEVMRRLGGAPIPGSQVTLLSPERYTEYSGLVPSVVAGHCAADACRIDLEALCARSGVEFVRSAATGIDLAARQMSRDGGGRLSFDIVSFDIGSRPDTSVPGAAQLSVAVKPVSVLFERWDDIRAACAQGPRRIAVVGGGAAGVEVLLSMHYRIATDGNSPRARFDLVTDGATILPTHAPAVRRAAERALRARGITVHAGHRVARVTESGLTLENGAELECDHVIWATAACAPPWIAESGLATDARGFIAVDACLRSTSHAQVFAAGDIASLTDHALPKSGVHAVRQGPPLAANLRRALAGLPLRPYRPQRLTLALIGLGDRRAIASYGTLAVNGSWVWHWKRRIDTRFMRRYQPAVG